MYSALFLAQIRPTVGYLVIPTRTGLRSAEMSEQQKTQPRSRSNARGCISGYVIENSMGRQASAREC